MKSSNFITKVFSQFFLLFFCLAFAANLSAQTKLSVQGLLKKSDGTSLPDGNYNLKFRFYNAENGGLLVGTSDANSTEINGGVYSTLLDPGALPFDVPYFVSVAVDGGTELLPRIALSAAPYAISLQGANNKFPSVGTVKADAIDVAGAVSAASYGAVNATTVNATGAVSGASVSVTGAVSGASVSATGAVSAASVSASGGVSGNHMTASGGAPSVGVAGKGYSFGAGGDADGGLFSVGDNNVALYAGATKALEANIAGVSVPGYIRSGAGYAFTNDDDSGLFSNGDGTFSMKANDQQVMFANTSGFNIQAVLHLALAPNMTDGDNLEWKSGVQGGRVGVNTSSRRYKCNIQPLKVDFSRILQVQPRIYNRKSEGTDKFEIGYIAEEIDSLGMKDLVLYDQEGRPNSLIYKKFIIYTNEVVKMQHADIEQLKAEVAALTAEKNTLRTENTSLRADMQNQQADFGKQFGEITRRLKSLETAASNR